MYRWRFIIQHLPQDHWVAVCRAPPGAVVDSHGGFLATFQYPHMSPQELQVVLLCLGGLVFIHLLVGVFVEITVGNYIHKPHLYRMHC